MICGGVNVRAVRGRGGANHLATMQVCSGYLRSGATLNVMRSQVMKSHSA